ncbi:hypothetical protein Bbelb_140420 [Branchiostoma belcheri]|nr:hypothetical protein Bbelb_140420 [Branchiostoma belcheri]
MVVFRPRISWAYLVSGCASGSGQLDGQTTMAGQGSAFRDSVVSLRGVDQITLRSSVNIAGNNISTGVCGRKRSVAKYLWLNGWLGLYHFTGSSKPHHDQLQNSYTPTDSLMSWTGNNYQSAEDSLSQPRWTGYQADL